VSATGSSVTNARGASRPGRRARAERGIGPAGQGAVPLSGRRAEAARNDARVLEAAREVLALAPDAPMAAVARRAGVGVGSLYRRYPSKEALVARLCLDAALAVEGQARVALERARAYPWGAFVGFMTGALAEGSVLLIAGLAGRLGPNEELAAAAGRVRDVVDELLAFVQAAGAIRPDVVADDLALLFTQLRAIRHADEQRALALRRRSLELTLQALHASGAAPLPGPAPTGSDLLAASIATVDATTDA
jgi:AcrR family transcriptional regulator